MLARWPTYAEMVEQAKKLDYNTLRRHASVSTRNRCKCYACYCCACAHVVQQRRNQQVSP